MSTQQITENQFLWKVIGISAPVLMFLFYLVLRSIFGGKRRILSAQIDEEKMLMHNQIKLRDLQTSSWQFNADKVLSYASFGLSTLILAATFIFQQRLQSFDALIFTGVLTAFSVSVLAYFISLQLWFLALDVGVSDYTAVRYRRRATVFQTIGWLTLILASLIAVMAINTILGYIFSSLAVLSLIFVYEYKARVSLDNETLSAEVNDFQSKIEVSKIYEKNLSSIFKQPTSKTIRISSWNIERGYSPKKITEFINEIKPNIVCLQEVDWGNLRTRNIDVLDIIARETNMRGYFGLEFFEIQTPYRSKRLSGGGVHGNCILTNIKPSRLFRVELPATFDWNSNNINNKLLKTEKRRGSRFALCANFVINKKKFFVSSVHLEDKDGGAKGRYNQFLSLVESVNIQKTTSIVLGGDFNTLDNWLTRIIGYSKASNSLDNSFFQSESALWKQKFLPELGLLDPFNKKAWTVQHSFLYREKLDWLMVKNCQIVNKGIGGFNSSDHKPIWIDVEI